MEAPNIAKAILIKCRLLARTVVETNIQNRTDDGLELISEFNGLFLF